MKVKQVDIKIIGQFLQTETENNKAAEGRNKAETITQSVRIDKAEAEKAKVIAEALGISKNKLYANLIADGIKKIEADTLKKINKLPQAERQTYLNMEQIKGQSSILDLNDKGKEAQKNKRKRHSKQTN